MKKYNFYGSLFCTIALGLSACTSGPTNPPIGQTDAGITMSVDVGGLNGDQSFCFSWKLLQEDEDGKWEIIDQSSEEVCGDPGDLSVSDFATCYDGLRFLVQYDITVRDEDGDEIGSATATSGGGEGDVCVKNFDTDSSATIQFNNEGSAGGVNPGIDVDLVCSNDKVQLEDGELVSALWLQSDSCELDGDPDSYCILGCGSGIETQRIGITTDGSTRFIFSTSDDEASWDLIYLAFEPDAGSDGLTLLNSPFALHHFADDGDYGREELTNSLASYRLGNSVGLLSIVGDSIVVTYDLNATCDGEVDLDSHKQVIEMPECPSGCDAVGVVETGGSEFDIILNCEGEIFTSSCDADGLAEGGICGEVL